SAAAASREGGHPSRLLPVRSTRGPGVGCLHFQGLLDITFLHFPHSSAQAGQVLLLFQTPHRLPAKNLRQQHLPLRKQQEEATVESSDPQSCQHRHGPGRECRFAS
ncbi:hypothetical protein RB213_012802, partial [Colletotrichum asianum]